MTGQERPDYMLTPLSQRVEVWPKLPLPDDLGVVWRPLHATDAQRLYELIARAEEADQAHFRTSLVEVQEFFDGDWKNPETQSLVGVDQTGKFVVYGLIEMPPGDTSTRRAYLSGAVHPDSRTVGLGSACARWLTVAAQEHLARIDDAVPGRIATVLEDNAPEHAKIFTELGFTTQRFYRTLRRDLSQELPHIDLEPGLELLPYSEALDEPTRRAHNDAFRDHWGSQPKTSEDWNQGRAMFLPEGTFVVVDTAKLDEDGEPFVVGYLWASKYEQDWAVNGFTSGYIDILGVRREYRGRKIGVRLLLAAMTQYRALGLQYAELDVDSANPSGALGIYTQLGFEVSSGSTMYSLEY